MKYTNDFAEAPAGTSALEVCCACGQDTGTILLKKRGPSPDRMHYTGGSRVVIKGAHCEFCEFVGLYKSSEGYEGRMAAGKIVEGDERKLVAFVPFLEDEDIREITVGDEQIPRAHGLVIRAERLDSGSMKLVEVLERGIPCDEREPGDAP